MEFEQAKKRAEELKPLLQYYTKKYFDDEQVVSDYEYDMLMRELKQIEKLSKSKGINIYKVIYDEFISGLLGVNYCICIQWNALTMEPGNIIYVRAFDKFTRRMFKPQFDTRGYDNVEGTSDDVA